MCFYSCGKPEEPKPTPTPVNPSEPDDPPTPPEDKDTKAPTITLVTSSVGIYGGKVVTIEAGKLSIGETEVASWTDDKSAADKCTVALSFTEASTKADAETKAGTTIKSGDILDKAGSLTLTVTDEAGNSASKDITLTEDNSAPEVKVLKESVDVYGGKAVTAKDNTLSIGDDAVLQWTDDHGDECTLTLALDGAEVSIGGEVSKAGTLKVTVTDSKGLQYNYTGLHRSRRAGRLPREFGD